MPVRIHIRRAKVGDRDGLAQILYEVRREDFFWIDSSIVAIDDFDVQTEGEEIYVAEVNGEVCAFVSVWQPTSFIHHLYVRKGARGREIGKRLLEVVEQIYPLPLRLKCIEKNEGALRFYARNGWNVVERDDGDVDVCLLMEYGGPVGG